MPPTRSSSKRKSEAVKAPEVAPPADGSPSTVAAPPAGAGQDKKRTKTSNGNSSKDASSASSPAAPSGIETLADPSLPTNKDFPKSFDFDPKTVAEDVRVTIWNVCSLKSCSSKGLFTYLEAEQPDIAILSETKCNEVPDVPRLNDMFEHQYWGIGSRKGYAGLAVLSKLKPDGVVYGLPTLPEVDMRHRCITLEFPNTYVLAVYAVNAGEGLKTLEEKKQWNTGLETHVRALDKKKPVIWCGDHNVVFDERDVALAKKKWNKSAGYTQVECDAYRQQLDPGPDSDDKRFVDAWRNAHPDAAGHYVSVGFHSYRGFTRGKGIGWRLDTFNVSERILSRVKACEIRYTAYGASDHIPVMADFEGPL